MKKNLLFLICMIASLFTFGQEKSDSEEEKTPKDWKQTLMLGVNYNQTKLTNPPVGYGLNQAGGNIMVNFSSNFDKEKVFIFNSLDWKFGLLRFGGGTIPGTDKKIPFQKTLDQLRVANMTGYRLSKDSTVSLLTGFDLFTQVTPSFVDADGQVPGVFLKDIRNSGAKPIQSNIFAPANVMAYVGVLYQPSPKFYIAYSPTTYKGIIVLNDAVAQLVGKVDDQGLPTATVHGNAVEIVNGVPVFKKHYSQFGSYLITQYKDSYFKNRIGFMSKLQLFSNYLSRPEKIDVYWQNKIDLNIIKGLSLTYMLDVYYDYDVLVQITDNNQPGGFSGELGRKVSLQRQFMLQYQFKF